jgi:hypothetical protein
MNKGVKMKAVYKGKQLQKGDVLSGHGPTVTFDSVSSTRKINVRPSHDPKSLLTVDAKPYGVIIV